MAPDKANEDIIVTISYFTENVPGALTTIVRAAIGTQAQGITDSDTGKAVVMGADQNYTLAADGNNIQGFITSVEAYTVNDGFAFGGVQTGCRAKATVGAGTVAVLNAVVASTQEDAGVDGDIDHPAKVKASATPTAYDTGWRCIRIVSGTGAVGDVVLLEAI